MMVGIVVGGDKGSKGSVPQCSFLCGHCVATVYKLRHVFPALCLLFGAAARPNLVNEPASKTLLAFWDFSATNRLQ